MNAAKKLKKFIDRRFPNPPYIMTAETETECVFMNRSGNYIGILDLGKYYALHDMSNKEDTKDNPTMKLTKGKKVKVIRS